MTDAPKIDTQASRTYSIFHCTSTLSLLREADREGFAVWAPTYRDLSGRLHSALPGFVFVPEEREHDFRSWAPRPYRVRPMRPNGCGEDALGIARCSLEDLRAMEDALNAPPPVAAASRKLVTGDRITVIEGVFIGFSGVFIKYKGGNRARIRIEGAVSYVDLPLQCLN